MTAFAQSGTLSLISLDYILLIHLSGVPCPLPISAKLDSGLSGRSNVGRGGGKERGSQELQLRCPHCLLHTGDRRVNWQVMNRARMC